VIGSHFAALTVFALIVAVVFAIITKSTLREQVQYGVFVFISFLAAGIVLGWIMYPFPF
jgi:hypothetical protein